MYNAAAQGVDPVRLVRVAQHAESLGFESLDAPEHISLHAGESADGLSIPPDTAIADPLECPASSRRARSGSCSDHHWKVRLSSRPIQTFASFDFPGHAAFRGSTTQTPSSPRSSASSQLTTQRGRGGWLVTSAIHATGRDLPRASSCFVRERERRRAL
jgi:hypothetical protein